MSAAGRNKGFSVIEGLLAAALLAVAAAALLLPFSVGAANNTMLADQAAGVNLAEAMMEEILTRPFYDPDGESHCGPEPGEAARTGFDNIDDYHGCTEAAGGLCKADGSPMDDVSLSALGRNVTVDYVRLPGQGINDPYTFARVTVRVTAGPRTIHTLTRMIGRRNDRPLAGGVSP